MQLEAQQIALEKQKRDRFEKVQRRNELVAQNLAKINEQAAAKARREELERLKRLVAENNSKQQERENNKAKKAANPKETQAYWAMQVQRKDELIKAERREELQYSQMCKENDEKYKSRKRQEEEQRRRQRILCGHFNTNLLTEKRKQAEEGKLHQLRLIQIEDETVYKEEQRRSKKERPQIADHRQEQFLCSQANIDLATEKRQKAKRQKMEERDSEMRMQKQTEADHQQKQEIQARKAVACNQDLAEYYRAHVQSKEAMKMAKQN